MQPRTSDQEEYIQDNISNLYASVEGQLVFMYFLNSQKDLQHDDKKTIFLYNSNLVSLNKQSTKSIFYAIILLF